MSVFSRFRDAGRVLAGTATANVLDGSGDFYDEMVGLGRGKRPLSYSPFVRCINMLSDDTARLIVETLYIEDRDGVRWESRLARERVDVLRETLDGGPDSSVLLLEAGGGRPAHGWHRSDASGLRGHDARRNRADRSTQAPVGSGTQALLGAGQSRQRLQEPLLLRAGDRPGEENPGRPRFSIAPIDRLADTILTAQNAERWLSDFFKSNFKTNIVLSPQGRGTFSTEDYDRLKEQVKGYLRGEAPLIVGRDARVSAIEQKASDQDTTDILDYLLTSTARMFGVPPQLLGLGDGKGVGVLYDAYWRQALAPTVHKLLAPLSLRILRRGYRFSVDETASLVRGSLQERTNWINAIRPNTGTMPLYTVNEIRRKQGDPPLTA